MNVEKTEIRCLDCGKKDGFPVDATRCPGCGGVLQVEVRQEYLQERFGSKDDFKKLGGDARRSMWRFIDFLPVSNNGKIVSLGEGNTPLLKSINLGGELGAGDLFLKVETGNPTGSFKDRQVSVGITKAIEWGKRGAFTVSSGNVGAAVAAYSARAGLKAIILVPFMSPGEKIVQARMHGATVARIRSNSTASIIARVSPEAEKRGFVNLVTASPYNPYINHGARTIALEIALDCMLKGEDIPRVVVCPVGGGGLIANVYKGFELLHRLDLIDDVPKMVGVQPAGCAPLATGIIRGLDVAQVQANPWKEVKTIASALADDVPLDAHLAMPAIRESGGTAIIVDDGEILAAEKKLARTEGIFAEPSSATVVAAFERMLERDIVSRGERTALLVTGSGFKDMGTAMTLVQETPEISLDSDEWKTLFR